VHFDTVIANGSVVIPGHGRINVDLGVAGERVAALLAPGAAGYSTAQRIDASGKYILPAVMVLEGRSVTHVFPVEIHDDKVGVGADRERALVRGQVVMRDGRVIGRQGCASYLARAASPHRSRVESGRPRTRAPVSESMRPEGCKA